ncbi:FAD-dependent oxidoreductase, partial [Gammaproteobacteria bacterium]|nr:FAD-dependent oxidoreductase [Gammaproteobacteria bacterium]
MTAPIVIVGAGQAAASFISRHVALASPQPVLLLGEESHPPYQRPPLSKKYLLGQLERDRLFIRPLEWYGEQNIGVRFDTRIDALEPDHHRVLTNSGEFIEYDKLLLCTGSSARRLPDSMGGSLDGVFTLRSIADIDRVAPKFQ